MAAKNDDFAKLVGVVTVGFCIAAIFHPPLRRWCLSLLCKL